ncbi:signal peptide peptidase-domain-containing protein [Podospora fimiseda]|uniref:Signal peptide peptidase-domain-containing protein n=1 Tax=Podospora fimiseda TaxID=252190 RepID=A0AAN7GZA6_9PEZI|nr:signal peptide peptidase-domain-containing protein [Podospora fimiseda]
MASQNTTTTLEGNSTSTSPSTSPTPFEFIMLLKPEYLSVVLSALTIIWLGAHGSLRRPPSAAPVKITKRGQKPPPKEDKFQEGLTASDAIMFPILAAVLLMSLYYLIEWLQDPTLLSKIMRGYMSLIAVISLARLAGDALEILTSLVFPGTWVDLDSKRVYHVDGERRCQYYLVEGYTTTDGEVVDETKKTPLPGRFGSLRRFSGTLWEIRHLLTEEWTVRFAMHGIFGVKFNIKLNDILGFLVSLPVAIAYHYTGWNVFSNVLSTGMCYASFLMLSPTSIGVGTLVLWGLFVYDVVMVFYTPYMITVAQKLDAPIKLVFESSSGSSMLGLGDIVVPGMLMGIALRFDLFQFYKKQMKLEAVELATTESAGVISTDTQFKRVKIPYVDTRGQWGNRFWCTKIGSLLPVKEATEASAATAFPKPYFYASVAGYAAGMLVTLTMLLVFRHGQPALLYLVPGVTGAIWLTALAKGEIKDVWAYTEDGSLDTEDVVVEVDANGQIVPKKAEDEEEKKKKDEDGEKKKKQKSGDYDVFLFSITAPRFALKED